MFYSKNLVTLNLAAETVAALIYPFSWHMPWLPCLPVDTIIDGDLLESPVPIVCGLHSQMRTLFTLPSEVCFCLFGLLVYSVLRIQFVVADLDANLVTAEEPVRRLPSEDRKRLIESLKVCIERASAHQSTRVVETCQPHAAQWSRVAVDFHPHLVQQEMHSRLDKVLPVNTWVRDLRPPQCKNGAWLHSRECSDLLFFFFSFGPSRESPRRSPCNCTKRALQWPEMSTLVPPLRRRMMLSRRVSRHRMYQVR